MIDVRIPYVGEKLWHIGNRIVEEVKIKRVEYIDSSSSLLINIKTDKGRVELYNLYEDRNRAELVLESKEVK